MRQSQRVSVGLSFFGAALIGSFACQTKLAISPPACSSGECADVIASNSGGSDAGSVGDGGTDAGSDDPCTGSIRPGTERTCTYSFAGDTRSFLVYAPSSYNPAEPAGVVIDAHGATESARQHAGLEPFKTWPGGLGSGWRLVADSVGAVIVTPQGLGNVWDKADADFVRDIRSKIMTATGVDSTKVFLSGISNGGMLNYWSTCDGVEEFGGISPISSTASGLSSCTPKTPTRMIAFHSKGDIIIPYSYGRASAVAWAKANGCSATPTTGPSFGGQASDASKVCLKDGVTTTPRWSLVACGKTDPATTCEEWTGCNGGVEVLFCTVPASSQPVGGHILYFNDTKLSLAAVTWNFFTKP